MSSPPTFLRSITNYMHNLFDRTSVHEHWHNIQQGWSVVQTRFSPHKPLHEPLQYEYPTPILSHPVPKRRRQSLFSDSPMHLGTPATPVSANASDAAPPPRTARGLRSALRSDQKAGGERDIVMSTPTSSAFRKVKREEMLDVEALFGYPSARRKTSNGVIRRSQTSLAPVMLRPVRKKAEPRVSSRRMSLPVATSRVTKRDVAKQIASKPWRAMNAFEKKLFPAKTPSEPRVEATARKRRAQALLEGVMMTRAPLATNGAAKAVKENVQMDVDTEEKEVNMIAEQHGIDRNKLKDILPAEFVDLIDHNPKLRHKVIKLHGSKMIEAWQAEMRMRKRQAEIEEVEVERLKLKARKEAMQERLKRKEKEDGVEEPFGDHFSVEYWKRPDEWVEEDGAAEREREGQISVTMEGSAFAPLTNSAVNRLRRVLWEWGNDGRELIKVNGCVITGQDLGLLKPHVWLNDEVVNAYMELLGLRNQKDLEMGKKVPRIRVMNSFFYSKLVSPNRMTGMKEYDYSRVRRWTRRFDAFSYDMLFIPINENNTHWTLGVVNFRDKKVVHLDSMGTGGSMTVREHLLTWVRDEAADKHKTFVQSEWGMPLVQVPKQQNSDDCGVFLCKFADFLARGWDRFTFDQQHMNYFRSRIAHELLMGKAT